MSDISIKPAELVGASIGDTVYLVAPRYTHPAGTPLEIAGFTSDTVVVGDGESPTWHVDPRFLTTERPIPEWIKPGAKAKIVKDFEYLPDYPRGTVVTINDIKEHGLIYMQAPGKYEIRQRPEDIEEYVESTRKFAVGDVVTSVEDYEALPIGTVISFGDNGDGVWYKSRCWQGLWSSPGDLRDTSESLACMESERTILWLPEEEK